MHGSISPIVVVGTYRSGSSAVAGILHYLGVDMGAPFWGEHFESAELAAALRRWWNEPQLIASLSAARRQSQLKTWLASRQRTADRIGVKHPLLSLCGEDLLQAWGSEVRFVWCQRPLAAAIDSLVATGWWADAQRIQQRLHAANVDFFEQQPHCVVRFEDTLRITRATIDRLISELGLEPSLSQIEQAVEWIKQWPARQQNRVGCSVGTQTTSVTPSASTTCDSASLPSVGNRIVATLLSGNSQALVAEAVASVIDWVDELCLIDTGITDETRNRVAAVAGPKLHIERFAWCDDFAAARNAALDVARQRGATWALTVDADERMDFSGWSGPAALRAALDAHPTVHAWSVAARDGTYSKERFIRLPTQLSWRGRTHETLTGSGKFQRRQLAGCGFWEARKSPASQQHKLQRDLGILLEETASQPLNARWWYYLGQTYEGLGDYRRAIEAFEQCIYLDGWPDESAWACYTAARCSVALQEYREAEEYCSRGIARKPTAAELPWLAGWCCYQRGAYAHAVAWCKWAIMMGRDQQSDSAPVFRYVPAWFEAPYDVLRHVFRVLGQTADAAAAEEDFQAAKAQRLALFSAPVSP
jgi:tetratricopeptide (TPR) repeat protein